MSEDGAGEQAEQDMEPTTVAIACQGGGSHTAFTAGALEVLLTDVEWGTEYELVGISGTSGGAFNALAAWYGLVTEGPARAVELVEAVWADLVARSPSDRATNAWLTGLNMLESSGVPLPELSPYQVPGAELGRKRIRETLEAHIPFDEIPPLCDGSRPDLVVGTVDVEDGVFETFVNEAVTVDAVLASAAVPELFEAVEIDGHGHWDGLFSQNPPINDLMNQPPGRKPEELWVIQINPQTADRVPTSVREINDRRNELSGNISLNQELRFIERVNEWVATGKLPADEFTQTTVRRLQMSQRYGAATKVNRDPAFVEQLMMQGRERARAFVAEAPNGEADNRVDVKPDEHHHQP